MESNLKEKELEEKEMKDNKKTKEKNLEKENNLIENETTVENKEENKTKNPSIENEKEAKKAKKQKDKKEEEKKNKEKVHEKTEKKDSKKKKYKKVKQTEENAPKFEKADIKNKKNKKEIEEMEKKEKPKKKRWVKILIATIIVMAIALVFSTVFAFININNEKIISGVSIKGIDVSGLTKEEAKAKLELVYNEKMEKDIELKYQEYEAELNPTLMEVKYDIDKAVEEAYEIGKSSNIFVNNYNILFTLISKKDINVNMSLNEDVTKQTINDIGLNLPGICTESSYSVEGENLIITKGKAGIYIDTDNLLNQVKDKLNDINEKENFIEIPVTNKEPTPIDIDKIHSEIYKEAKDAYYTKNPFTVYPEVEGVDFDVEAAKKLIESEDKDEYVIKLTITKPKITIDQIGPEAFPDQLSTFSTRYDASDKDRTTNLRLACQKLNGKVVLAGETFSYNATLGARTTQAGYKNAKVYENGEVVDGIGGGICQISSTLYNAALMSDMEIVSRTNHQFVTSYVGAGRDATVVYGAIDFKFKNTRTYPIKIMASCQNGIAKISIFGIKEESREYTYTFSTKTIKTIPYTTKYIEDSSLASGKEVVKQKGANGLVTETYMTKMQNGKVISTKLLSKDTYSAMQRIVRRGKAGTTQTAPETKTETENTQTEEKQENTTSTEQNGNTVAEN